MMNEIEEKIWTYIEGTCTPQERQTIARLIEQDAAYRNIYEELMQLDAELHNMELEEPPMAFTYNVMQSIRTAQEHQPLKTSINKNIILLLAGIFIAAIGLMLVHALSSINWTVSGPDLNHFKDMLRIPSLKNYMSAPVLKVFLFFDVLLALALFDGYLRRKNVTNQV